MPDTDQPLSSQASAVPVQADDSSIIARVGIKAPEFWRTELELWFLRLEAQFRQAKITADNCKFDHTVASLNSEVLSEVADLLRNPTTGRAYEALKARLLDRYGIGPDERIHRLMEMTLGDLKPTQLIHKMQALALGSISAQVLKNLWLDRLPPQVRGVISILDGDMEELAKKADSYMRSVSFPVMPISEGPALDRTVAALSDQVSALSKKVAANEQTQQVQQVKASNSSPTHSLCYYHQRFGALAKKCRPPCTVTKNDQGVQ
ncbi:uncharacterized protein LOC126746570 [Anthonomus grandis grandis]|uniref:uncharacterized protein LOC126746570 n=1 Tax=Anthonomus grandis grandis TaxID=2921223 RepID=UPI0021650587|nr:uncharacterized protein LOC126746570 [Anthonomus grandis grandis]